MKLDRWHSQLALLALYWLASTCAWAARPEAIAQRGAGQTTACATCHGKDGGGQSAFPRLAGMNAIYLRKQLEDFAGGRRDNALMKPIATSLSAEDRSAMARYYQALPVPPALARTAKPSAKDGGVGERLATRGAWDKGVPACVQCHGPGGTGVGSDFPALAGQSSAYIAAQLQAWRSGTRRNDPLELMRHLSGRLDENEISAVADWFAGQPIGTRAPK